MHTIIAELHVYVLADGSKRRVYRTNRNANIRTNRETSYFYIGRDGKSHYLSEIEVIGFPDEWLPHIPIRNN